MNILYIGYWGANEGLSQATINPHLEILLNHSLVDKLTYVSIERGGDTSYQVPKTDRFEHIPLIANKFPFRLLNKAYELITFAHRLTVIAKKHDIDLVICRSSLAGNFGLTLHNRLQTPFVVESFEPHAEYMRELGIWSKNGLSYRYQHRQEQKQKKFVYRLYPVAENFKNHLINEGVEADKIITLPCSVDVKKFIFSKEKRQHIRNQLNLSNETITAIYVGKFGDIYYSMDKALALFKKAKKYFENFHLILLTPDSESVRNNMFKTGFQDEQLTCKLVSHDQVPAYLSASDFAFSLINETNFSAYCSPIKNGEYWANGLPVLMPNGIGDDSSLLRETGLGVVMKNDVSDAYFRQIYSLIQQPDHREKISTLATQNRSFDRVEQAYSKLIGSLSVVLSYPSPTGEE